MVRAYEEIIDFLAAGTSQEAFVAFRPSDAARARVADLLRREKNEGLSHHETSELNHHLQLEHVTRLLKARARAHLLDE